MYRKRKITKSSLFSILIMVFVLGFGAFSSVYAYEDTKLSPQERAVFLFFKSIGQAPDYEYWIATNRDFLYMPESQQEEYLVQETLRLGRGASLLGEFDNTLEINANVVAKYFSATEDKPPRMTFRFLGPEGEYIPSFNYPYGRDTIAMVINNLASFSDMPLTPEQDAALLKKIPYTDKDFDAVITVTVMPSNKSQNYPTRNDKGDLQWLMIGEVAHMKCEIDPFIAKDNQTVLWDFVAPWYAEQHRLKNMSEEEKVPHPYDLFKK